MSLKYSHQHPKWMMEKSRKKLQGCKNNPASITPTKMTAVRALVLKVVQLNVIKVIVVPEKTYSGVFLSKSNG